MPENRQSCVFKAAELAKVLIETPHTVKVVADVHVEGKVVRGEVMSIEFSWAVPDEVEPVVGDVDIVDAIAAAKCISCGLPEAETLSPAQKKRNPYSYMYFDRLCDVCNRYSKPEQANEEAACFSCRRTPSETYVEPEGDDMVRCPGCNCWHREPAQAAEEVRCAKCGLPPIATMAEYPGDPSRHCNRCDRWHSLDAPKASK